MKKWLLIGGGLVGLCCLSSGAVLALGAGSDSPAGESGGGFSFTPPAEFTADGPGRVKATQQDGSSLNTVEVLQLAAIEGRDDAEQKLRRFWNEAIARDWDEVQPEPIVMRRFVANGARAVFTGGKARAKQGNLAFVTVLLVDDDTRLVPLVIIQTSQDPNTTGSSTRDMSASMSWSTSWALAERALTGVRGSPVGLPLVDDAEVTGAWVYSTGSQLQWVARFTGRTGMDVVSYAIDYDFDDDHRYRYKFNGASGTVGALNFATEKAEGTWGVKHDVLTLTSDAGKITEYLILGAPTGPDGMRLLHLLPKPHWDLTPGVALANGELYRPR